MLEEMIAAAALARMKSTASVPVEILVQERGLLVRSRAIVGDRWHQQEDTLLWKDATAPGGGQAMKDMVRDVLRKMEYALDRLGA